MSRINLVKARQRAGYDQGQFAQLLEVDQSQLSKWESGKVYPTRFYRDKIHDILGDDPELFDIVYAGSPKGLRNIMEMLRRQFLEWLGGIGGASALGNVSLAIVSAHVQSPDEYIEQAKIAIADCWDNLSLGLFHKVERTLNAHMPTLKRLATTISPFQSVAANLGVQACVMKVLLATRNADFLERESRCVQAVQFGALSGDRRLWSTALYFQGETYTFCYNQPQRAIDIFNDALSLLGSDASLDKSRLYIDMAIAHAQQEDERERLANQKLARDYIEQAHMLIPSNPELDPFFSRYIRMGHSELVQFEGKVYLKLAKHFPNEKYGQWAYDALEKSIQGKPINTPSRCQALIRKADAARAMNELGHFKDCLEQALPLIGSEKKLINDANDVLGRIPEKWQREDRVISLQKEVARASQIVTV